MSRTFRAGASAVDITPETFPVIVSGGFFPKTATVVLDPLHARSLVLDDGETRVAITIVDSGMLPREIIDEAKSMASQATGIPISRMLVAATHTHAAPAAVAALGSSEDPTYVRLLPGRIAESIRRASAVLAPACIGWTHVEDWDHTFCRRWITHPDKMIEDPFGARSARAMMHPGYQNPDYVSPAGPVDPDLWLFALRSPDGRPMALLANYSMHYFGSAPLSADYYGRFSAGIGALIGAPDDGPPFVGMMSQGTSGDLHWMDYSRPKRDTYTIDQFAAEMLQVAAGAYARIRFEEWVPLKMAETRLTLRRRVPDPARMTWAQDVIAAVGNRPPATKTEVYAREQLLLAQTPERELKFQALSIGHLGIAAMPTEAFALTGLKIKAMSPLESTFTIELANGAEGYVPPVEQHALGGYVTWPARTAGLEIGAEEKITHTLLELLERVAARPRRPWEERHGPYAQAVLESGPFAYWRLNEFGPPVAIDASENGRHATYEGHVAFYLPGAQSRAAERSTRPEQPSPFSGDRVNRAPYFAGGRMRAALGGLGHTYSVSLWIWLALADDPPFAGRCFLARESRGRDDGEYLGISGTVVAPRHVFFRTGGVNAERHVGADVIEPRTWNHVVLVRGPRAASVYLNGELQIPVRGGVERTQSGALLILGGGGEGDLGFEGKLDEVSVHDRELTAKEISAQYRLSCPVG